jgi:hypothetical protein
MAPKPVPSKVNETGWGSAPWLCWEPSAFLTGASRFLNAPTSLGHYTE